MYLFFKRHRKKQQTRTRASLVPEPSSLRDFSLHLKSNNLNNNQESFSLHFSNPVRSNNPTASPTYLRESLSKSTFRPPTLLRTNPNLVASAAAAGQETRKTFRNFNDLWVRLENEYPNIR